MKLCVLLQLMPHNQDGRVHQDRCEEDLHIITFNAFPSPKYDGLYLIHNALGVPYVMWGMSYQWPKDIGQCLRPPHR